MKTLLRKHPGSRGFVHSLLATSLLVMASGVASLPAQAARTGVDQSPLIIQRSLPPNLVLMFDESTSMDRDYMPDTLSDSSIDGFHSSDVSGTYYNPNITYLPPPKADGTFYNASPSLGGAYKDGFRDNSATDVTGFTGNKAYFEKLNVSYPATPNCNNGYTYNESSKKCVKSGSGSASPTWSCPNGGVASSGQCSGKGNFFVYTIRKSSNSYTKKYVGKTGSCAVLSSSADRNNCDDGANTQQNVANWFSYYRTRMLMAKSGLMQAFSDIDPTFRVGFGSLNGQNMGDLGSNVYKFTTTYSGTSNITGVAYVRPFGDKTSDPELLYDNSQRKAFWEWLNNIGSKGSTPLRMALDGVGKYYKTDNPWISMESDPDYGDSSANAEFSCRQSFTILTTDGFWNGKDPSSDIGNSDNKDGNIIKSDANPGDSYQYKPALPFSGSQNITTLADVAMHYWKNDLRTELKNEVPTSREDPAFWQHMTTFTLGMGFDPVNGNSVSSSVLPVDALYAWAVGGPAVAGFSGWPNVTSNGVSTVSDLAHAGINGRGGFYSAKNPEQFASSLKDALRRAAARDGTGASLAANSRELTTDTMVYQPRYRTAKWIGELSAFHLDPDTGEIDATASWNASAALPAAASRNIKTFNRTATAGSQFIDFKLGAGNTLPALSAAQHIALQKVAGTAVDEADLINYLRGDKAKEQDKGGTFRNRDTPLGDIVNSQPVFVGQPDATLFSNATFLGSSTYGQYVSDQEDRAGRVYVAANDGMLHGFDAEDGKETFAYLPGAVITKGLSDLASTEYGGDVEHQFFNDGELTVADVYAGSPLGWKTVLVGTTGRGEARAVYALDVTDPDNVKFLWERSAGDTLQNAGYIGQMTGKPIVAQTSNGEWSVLIGNGYNAAQGGGSSALLQFDVTTGYLNVHTTSDGSGLAAPAVWMDPSGNGVSTVAWSGDANGNVWSFRLNDSSATNPTPSSAGVKIFTARDASGNAQSITGGLVAGKDPATGNTWVFFGTGRYLAASDLHDDSTQTWYGLIVDSPTGSATPVNAGMTRTNLAKRQITSEQNQGRTVTTLAEAQNAGQSMEDKSGWYMDLLAPTGTGGAYVKEGERMVTPSQFNGGLLIGTTRIPQASDPCRPTGRGWIMAIEPFSGTNPTAAFYDWNDDGKIDGGDSINDTPVAGIGFDKLPNNPIFMDDGSMLVSFDDGSKEKRKINTGAGSVQRVSWRELIAH